MRLRRDATGQVAMEYLIVFTMAFFMTVPLIIIFSVQTNNMQSDIAGAQLNKLSLELMDAAERVYYLGAPSQQIIEATFPKGIDNITFETNSLVFYMRDGDRDYVHYEDTKINITGSLRNDNGLRPVRIVALGTEVLITDE